MRHRLRCEIVECIKSDFCGLSSVENSVCSALHCSVCKFLKNVSKIYDLKKMDNLPYCPPDVQIYDIWSNCFLETLSASILTGFILIFGLGQLINYWKCATPIIIDSSTKLYYIQIILLTIIPSLSFVNLKPFYGYTVWRITIVLIYHEEIGGKHRSWWFNSNRWVNNKRRM